jgi:hypothetical protein
MITGEDIFLAHEFSLLKKVTIRSRARGEVDDD